MLNLKNFPDYFESYVWEDKHYLYGYPRDSFPDFNWILSLECRFRWLRNNCRSKQTASIYLMKEMIQWGGSQNGVLQKFEDGIGNINLQRQLEVVFKNVGAPAVAIAAALEIPGMGLTYASKLLRFVEPIIFGAFDSRLRRAFDNRVPGVIPRIYDGNINSMVNGYVAFVNHLAVLKKQLEDASISRPTCCLPLDDSTKTGWRAADIEMALYHWTGSNEL